MPAMRSNRIRLNFLAVIGLAAMLSIGMCMAPARSGATNPIELAASFSKGSSNCSGGVTDPVGVLFRGRHASAGNTRNEIKFHSDWNYDVHKEQHLYVNTGGSNWECREADQSVANKSDFPPSGRYHTRLWFVPATNGTGDLWTVGTPHHEDLTSCGHAVDENGPEGSGFDKGRRSLRAWFETSRHKVETGEKWGNTESVEQCDGGLAGSDGYGLTVYLNALMRPNTRGAHISSTTDGTLQGTLTTEEPTTEWWFAYGPNSSQGESGYPNKTAVHTTTASGEFEKSEAISGLSPGTTYYVRMFARNQDGEVEEGPETTFGTCNWGPGIYDDSPGPHPIVGCVDSRHIFYRTPSGTLGHDWNFLGEWGWGNEVLDGSVGGEPHVTQDDAGSINVFYRTPSGGLGHNWWKWGDPWGSDVLPGEVAGEPHPILLSNGSRHIFYRTPSGGLGHTWNTTGEWGWHSEVLEGSVAGEPQPVISSGDSIDVFYRTPSNTLGHNWWTWGDPWGHDVLPGSVSGDPHPIELSNDARHIFYRTPSGGLGHDWNFLGEWGWGNETLDGSVASEPFPTISSGDSIDVFYRTPSNTLGHNWWTWGDPWGHDILPGEVAGNPRPVELSNDARHIFYRTPSGGLGHDWNFLGEWGWGNEVLDGSVASDPHPVVNSSDSIDVFYRTPSGGMGHDWWAWGDPWGSDVLPGSVASGYPSVRTEGPSSVATGKATLSGNVNPNGAATVYHFEWGKTSEYGHSSPPAEVAGLDELPVSHAAEGLEGQTAYHYRLVAENSSGVRRSPDRTFTTPDWRPSVTGVQSGEPYSHLGSGRIKINADINPNSFATTYHVEWGDQQEFESGEFNNSTAEEEIPGYTESKPVEVTVEGLHGETIYHYRFIAESPGGTTTVEAAGQTFTTPDWRPHIVYQGVKGGITAHRATAKATINSRAFSTSYYFEYVDDAEFQQNGWENASQSQTGGIGTGPGEGVDEDVERPLTELEPATRYHFRVIASSEQGTRYGPDGDLFATLPAFHIDTEIGEVKAQGLATDSQGDLYVSQWSSHIDKYNAQGEFLMSFGEAGSDAGQFEHTMDIAVDPEDDIYVVDSGNDRVEKFNPAGEFLLEFGEEGSGEGQFEGPAGITTDSQGNVYVTDSTLDRVEKFNPAGEFLLEFGEEGSGEGQLAYPQDVAIGMWGLVFVADTANNRLQIFLPDGEYLVPFGEEGSGEGQFSLPWRIASDSHHDLYVADFGNSRMQIVDTELESSEIDTGSEFWPMSVAVGPGKAIWAGSTGPFGLGMSGVREWIQPPGDGPTFELGGMFPRSFTIGGNSVLLDAGYALYSCNSASTGSGSLYSKWGGKLTLAFHGCAGPSNSYLTSPGQSPGTVVTAELEATLVYLDSSQTEIGLLLTPASTGPIAEFTGWGGLVGYAVTGEGIVASLTDPLLYEYANGFDFKTYGSESRQVEGIGPDYSLEISANGGSPEPFGLDGQFEATLDEGVEFLLRDE